MTERADSLFWYPGHDLVLPDIVRAENCLLHAAGGRTYVDLESGVWCTPLGHAHPRLVQVLAEQSARIAHAGYAYSSAVVERAAREILALLGFENGRCVFLCSGSEAIEYGVRVAQAVSDRPLLLTMTDSYFGAYGSASLRSADEWFGFDWQGCSGCPAPEAGDGARTCEHWAAIPFERIGGVILEPGSSSGLVRFPPSELIQAIVRRVTRDGGLVLVNEVTTGVGRTGTWFGHEHYGISPDIVALGKGIGNGYPVSVTAVASGVADRLGPEPIHYAQSHQNDPLGASIALEVIRVIREEGLIERSREVAQRLLTGLEGIRTRTRRIAEIRARGLMLALELEDDPEATFSRRVHHELLSRGFVLARRPGLNVLRIDPALTIELEHIEEFLETLEDILAGEPHATSPR